jgi:ornithine carbamoyltransferase
MKALPSVYAPKPPVAMKLKGRDFLALADYSTEEIWYLLQYAAEIKSRLKAGQPYEPLKGKTLGMIFEKSSTRTRVSFEVGMYQLGGQALFLTRNDLQLGRGETVADTAQVLSRYVDGLMIRTFAHDTVVELARAAKVPVINGLTDLSHPCQVLADLLTIQEYKGHLSGLKFAYIGDGNNMAHSILMGCVKMGIHVSIGAPEGYQPVPWVVELAKKEAALTGATVTITQDPVEAVKDADVIYTDVWASMGQETEHAARLKDFAPFQVNAELVKAAKPDYLFMHCLPAHREEEVTAEIIDGEHSIVFDQAENRLHAQKAILAALMG